MKISRLKKTLGFSEQCPYILEGSVERYRLPEHHERRLWQRARQPCSGLRIEPSHNPYCFGPDQYRIRISGLRRERARTTPHFFGPHQSTVRLANGQRSPAAAHDARGRLVQRVLGGVDYATSLDAASRRFTTHQNVVTALAFRSKKSSKNPGLLRGGGYA